MAQKDLDNGISNLKDRYGIGRKNDYESYRRKEQVV